MLNQRLREYLIITREIYKELLQSAQTEQGKQTLKYFIKIENLKNLMNKLIFQYMENKKSIEITELKNEVKDKTEKADWLSIKTKKNVSFKPFKKPREGNYLGANQTDSLAFIHKYSKSYSTKKRQEAAGCFSSPKNKFEMKKIYKTWEGLELATESYMHKLLLPFSTKDSDNKKGPREFFMAHKEIINTVASMVIESQTQIVQFINKYLEILKENNYDFNIVDDQIQNKTIELNIYDFDSIVGELANQTDDESENELVDEVVDEVVVNESEDEEVEHKKGSHKTPQQYYAMIKAIVDKYIDIEILSDVKSLKNMRSLVEIKCPHTIKKIGLKTLLNGIGCNLCIKHKQSLEIQANLVIINIDDYKTVDIVDITKAEYLNSSKIQKNRIDEQNKIVTVLGNKNIYLLAPYGGKPLHYQ